MSKRALQKWLKRTTCLEVDVWYSRMDSSMKGLGVELAATLRGGGTGLITTGKRQWGSWLSTCMQKQQSIKRCSSSTESCWRKVPCILEHKIKYSLIVPGTPRCNENGKFKGPTENSTEGGLLYHYHGNALVNSFEMRTHYREDRKSITLPTKILNY